ncbi:hypothetical protein PC115_g17219 [Phytophthora cactorum]|uniref:HAT C-terminal dimerisation domain-containing protein n=1 Tax=Phytophthora cactorum TaxID=29920 RepID=A0A8T1B9S1_9STRA|nr:hypothetical protein PC115_g17219 [Phytophthora cactorum]KAG2992892.1 hypothetical protein PC120_g22382 [Phytophthora cactorum]KAG3131094.1 hypothetical protein C6341_g23473 [Phytophthora cactorum]
MVDRYFRFYDKVDRLDDGLADIIHTPRENVPLKTLHEDLKNLECQQVTSDVGGVLARRMRTFRPHDFENGVVKVLARKVRALTRTEKSAIAKLLGSTESYEVVEDADGSPTKRYSAEAALSEGAPAASVANMKWVPPTSNDVERLFSRAGIVYSRLRRSLNPMTLETILFLQYNRGMWDASAVAQAVENNRTK